MAKKFLYFAEADVETTDEALLVPVSSYRGCDPAGTTSTAFYFEDVQGGAARETVTLTHDTNKNKEVIEAMVQLMNSGPHTDGFIVAADFNVAGGDAATVSSVFDGLVVSACAIA